MRLAKSYGAQRLEAAARRAAAIQACSFNSVQWILKHDLARQPLPQADAPPANPITHANVRGADYYR
jgi:hypothetical protein